MDIDEGIWDGGSVGVVWGGGGGFAFFSLIKYEKNPIINYLFNVGP